MTVAVVGAGPAGLAAALAAARLGLKVDCFEESDSLQAEGAWILGWPVQRALANSGVVVEGTVCRSLQLSSSDGRSLYRAAYREGGESLCVRRQDLLDALYHRCLEAGVKFHLGTRLQAPPSGDLVVGADGCRSSVRRWAGLRSVSRPLGHYYRGTLIGSGWSGPDNPLETWTSDGRRFGVDPIPGGLSFYCTAPAQDPECWPTYVKGWDVALAREILSRCAPASLQRCAPQDIWCAVWHRVPYFLVGDAAHGQPPNLGQGANLGMLDSFCLMQLVGMGLPLTEVGRRYQRLRSPFVNRLHALSVAACWWSHRSPTVRDGCVRVLNRLRFLKPWLLDQCSCHNAKERGWSYG